MNETRYHVMSRQVISNDGDEAVLSTQSVWPQGMSYRNAKHRKDMMTDAIGCGVVLSVWLVEAEQV